jgi:hypothetical protein
MSHDPATNHEETDTAVAAVERRLWERLACTRPIPRRLALEPGRELDDGWVVDLSAGGLCVLLNTRPERGAVLYLELESHPDHPPVALRARVVRVQAMPEGDWLVGCQYLEPISEETVKGLLL